MEGTEAVRGRTLPMNSKRLTGAYLQRIAFTLKLPTGGSNAETTTDRWKADGDGT